MAWVYLDDQFPDHPKVVAAGDAAAWMFVCGLAYCRRYNTEGRIPKAQVPKLTGSRSSAKLAAALTTAPAGYDTGLWEDHGDHYLVHDYGDWNKPQASRTESARKAARARWGNPKPDPPADAPRNANASKPDAPRNANASAEGNASTCPPPLPNDLPTSSNHSHSAPDPPDEDEPKSSRDPLIETALAVLAARDLEHRQARTATAGPVGDPVAWTNTAIDQRRERNAQALTDLAQANPGATPAELAELLEPTQPAVPAARPGGPKATAYDAQQAAQLARAQRHQRAATGQACPHCADSGWRLDTGVTAIPCNHQTDPRDPTTPVTVRSIP